MRRAPLYLSLLAGTMLAALPAAAQDTVRIRAGEHDDFGRLVFDWSKPVRYRAYVQDGQLHLEFARRAAFQLGGVLPTLGDYVGQAAAGPHGYRLTFPLKDEFGLKHWTSGPKVVVDLKDPNAPPDSAPTVRMRVGEHDTFDRLVFDWSEQVAYSVERAPDGKGARIRFARPAKLDLSAFNGDGLPRVKGVGEVESGTNSGVTLDIPPQARLRHFKVGPKVVVDVLAAKAADGKPGDGKAPDTEETPAPTATADSDDGAVERKPTRPPEKPEELARAVPEQASPKKEDAGAGTDAATGGDEPGAPLSLLPEAKKALARSAAEEAGGSAGQNVGTSGQDAPDAEPEADSRDASPPDDSERPRSRVTRVSFNGDERFPPQKVARGLTPQPGEMPPAIAASDLGLPWAKRHVAAYRRDGDMWLVAAGRAPEAFALSVQNANPAVRKATQQSHDGASVVRFDAIPGLQIRPRQDEGRWHLSLAAQSALPSRPLRVEVRDGRVVIPVEAAGPVVDMADPGAGGRLYVVPLAGAGQGMSLRRDFPEFTLLPTVVGVAIVPKAEHVAVSTGEEGVVIHGGARKLAVSNPGHGGGADATADALNGRRLLDLRAWRRADEPYSKARRRLQKAVVDAPPAKKHLARLELARFYFAHGLAAETLGALDVYTEKAPRRAEDPQVRLMAGAAHALQGEWREAGEALTHPSLDGALDALPWRAAHAAATGADEAAVNAFHRSENVLGAYPDTVRKRLHLAIAEARLRLGDTKAAKHNLEVARALGHNRSDRAEVDYLLARKLLAEGDVEEAETLWRDVATSDHASSRARARFVMVERDLAADRIDRKEAIARLERLRFAWRGDSFEAVLLHRLADLYAAGGEYRRALTALRQAASHLPDTAWAQGAADRMRDIFKQVFLQGGADRMPPLKALALYESFRELTPAEPEGDRMISNLVDRLVEVDLLERAADLLDGQVRHRLAGARRTKAGARLASIYLLDAKPGKALDALDISKGTGGSKVLVDRRRHLRARALAKLHRGDEALALLRGDNSADGLRLKADIHADAGRWGKAADALDGLLPNAPKPGTAMAERNVRQVLRSAVALTLAGRRDELDGLQERYGEAMRQSKHAETFRLLAGSEDGQGVSTIAQRLAEVSQAKAFMNTFQDSLQQQASLGGGQS